MDISSSGIVIGTTGQNQMLLSGAIKGVLSLIVLLSSVSPSVAHAQQDTTTLQTMSVSAPLYPPEYMGFPGANPQDFESGYGDGGYSDPGYAQIPCAILAATKPASCPNPIPRPAGMAYAMEELRSGTAITKLNYFINYLPGVSQNAKFWASAGLATQTDDFASRYVTFDEALKKFKDYTQAACVWQLYDSGPGLTYADKYCLDVLDRVIAESNDTNFIQWFGWWSQNQGINFSDLGIPQTVVDLFSPYNSIRVKYDKVTEDAKCSTWWQQVSYNQCSL